MPSLNKSLGVETFFGSAAHNVVDFGTLAGSLFRVALRALYIVHAHIMTACRYLHKHCIAAMFFIQPLTTTMGDCLSFTRI